MDFMNFMNQVGNNCEVGHRNHIHDNCGCCSPNIGNHHNGFSGLLPLLFLSGLGQTSSCNLGNMVCYPNQCQTQQYVTPTSVPCFNNGLKYKTKKVRQAYMEVPVSIYQVAQPYYPYPQQLPITANMGSINGNRCSFDLSTILLFLLLCSRNNNRCMNVCNPPHHNRPCGSCSTEI